MKVGFLGLLTLLFIGLKLTGYIFWSWFWVLSPIIIPLLIGLFITLVWGIFILILGSKVKSITKENIKNKLKDIDGKK